MTDDQVVDDDASGELQLEAHFAMVPEWVLFHPDLSDRAVRLYGILLRFGQSSGVRMPGRARLAQLLRVQSRRPVDRARAELEAAGALHVTRGGRTKDGQLRTNRYVVRVTPPDLATSGGVVPPRDLPPVVPLGTLPSVSTDPLPIVLTQSEEPPPPDARPIDVTPPTGTAEEEAVAHLEAAGVDEDLGMFIAELSCTAREAAASELWTRKNVLRAVTDAVAEGYPRKAIPAALRELAADPTTRGPARLAEAGPWWSAASREARRAKAADLLEHAERRRTEARAAADQLDARKRRQRELFEGLDDDTLARLHAEATHDVDEAAKRAGVDYSAGMRQRLVTTTAMQAAVADGLVPELDAIDVDDPRGAYA